MVEARKLNPVDVGLSPDPIRNAYPEFARLLQTRMDELLPRELAARSNLDEQVMTSPGDEADMSVLDNSADYFLKLANSHQEELIEIREALDRMHRGIYGICESCEEPVAIERLKRLPTARLCIDCQSTHERKLATLHPNSKPTL